MEPTRPSCNERGETAMTSTGQVTVATVIVIVALVAWFDVRLLADLAKTRDEQLRYLDRAAWAVIIVLTFPIGPMLYMLYAKGPRRRR
jgi:hypothetical protein